MSSTALTFFNQPAGQLPAHIDGFLGQHSNIAERNTTPTLSYEGKTWATVVNGERTPLVKRDAEGEEVPVSVMRVVLLDYGKRRGRAYYEGSYNPATISAPKCWSDDGQAPHADVREKPAATCAACPFSVKGSRISDNGKQVTACSQHRLVAVVPAANMAFTPLRLKLAITSDFDKQSPELEAQGWFAFSQYTDLLRSRGVKHTATLVTKMKFDPNAQYPKVMFSPDRWLTAEEMAQVSQLVGTEPVTGLLSSTYTPGPDSAVIEVDVDEEVGIAPTPMPPRPAVPPAAPVAPPAAPKPAAKAKPAPKPAPAPVAAPAPMAPVMMLDDDDEDEVPVKPVAKAKPAPVAAPAATISSDVPDDLASLLNDWGDE